VSSTLRLMLKGKIPTLRQAQGRLSRAKGAREMGHPACRLRVNLFAVNRDVAERRLYGTEII
jgi:hypothetical protein